ncbi:hypothetical protein ACS0TY_029764 [Phlomoides rotata]
MPLSEEIGEGRDLGDAIFGDEAAEMGLGFARVGIVLYESLRGCDVEHQLILKLVEDYDYEFGDAAEGYGVSPEAAGLELTGAGTDVGLFRAGWAGGPR